MKYIINKLSTDFIADELEQVRKEFVDGLTYTLESANITFNKEAKDPLDIYIEYDFQQKHGEEVIYGFNLREEIARNFELDTNKHHSSEQLLMMAKNLRLLADEIENRYDAEPTKTLADIEEKKDKKNTEYAKNINRSYKEILKDAIAQDQALQKERALNEIRISKQSIAGEYKLKSSQDKKPTLK